MDFPLFSRIQNRSSILVFSDPVKWSFSDGGFGISMFENPYFDYLIVPNGSGLIYLEWAQNKAIWWFCGGSVGWCTQTLFDFQINYTIGTSMVGDIRNLYFGGLNRSWYVTCQFDDSVGFPQVDWGFHICKMQKA